MIKQRTEKICNELKNGEAFIVSYPANRFYLTGFNSSAGTVVITHKKAYFIVDFRYFEKAKRVIDSCTVLLTQKLWEQIKVILKDDGVKTVYLENRTIALAEYTSYKKKLSDFEISDSSEIEDFLYKMRSQKSRDELQIMKAAQQLTDETFEYILNYIRSGKTEKEIALEMEFYMRRRGSEGVAFDFIVVSGENSSLPHGTPTDRTIRRGDLLTMDFGAVIQGYNADMTRTVAIGEVNEKQKSVYNTVLTAQLEAIKQIKAGAVCKDIDKIARDIIDNAGYKGCFGHSLGHSVGVEIHESPCFSPKDDSVLKSGMVLSVEPGIYIENEFGVRIEDVIYVTDDGCYNLTKSPKVLIII